MHSNLCEVGIEVLEGGTMPRKAHDSDSCFDLYLPKLCGTDHINIFAQETCKFPLSFKLDIPDGWEGIIRGRSGHALYGVYVHPGTLDACYKEEVAVIVTNISRDTRNILLGGKIAQITFARVPKVIFKQVEKVPDPTERQGGFGSSGL